MSFKILSEEEAAALDQAEQPVNTAEPNDTAEQPNEGPKTAAEEPPKEEPQPQEAPKVEATAPAVQQQPTEAPKEIKDVDPYELLGLKDDEFAKKFIEARKSSSPEVLNGLLKIMSTDWDKVDDVAMIRDDLRRQYPTLSDKALDHQLQKKLSNEFNIGESYDEDEQEVGKELLKAMADKLRDGRKAEQQAYEVPKIAPDPQQLAEQEKQAQLAREFEQHLETHPALKAFETNRIVQLGSGDDAFNFEADPKLDVLSTLKNGGIYGTCMSEDGKTFDMNKWVKIVNYAHNMEKVEAEYAKHLKGLGEKTVFNDELRNLGPDNTTGAAPASTGNFRILNLNG